MTNIITNIINLYEEKIKYKDNFITWNKISNIIDNDISCICYKKKMISQIIDKYIINNQQNNLLLYTSIIFTNLLINDFYSLKNILDKLYISNDRITSGSSTINSKMYLYLNIIDIWNIPSEFSLINSDLNIY